MEESRLLHQLWLSLNCDHDPYLVDRVLKKYHTAEEAFQANFYDSDFYKTLRLDRTLRMDRTLDKAKRLLEQCRREEITILAPDDPNYPKRLLEGPQPPQILYGIGNLPDLNQMLGITIVGPRACTKEGARLTEELAESLAGSGIGIISGMAIGIDGAAHCGAMKAGGTTIAVLAGGVDRVYPPEHGRLYRHILEYGGILSERPPGMSGQGFFYRQRNRILTGLAHGVIVVEGLLKSGTAITAKFATQTNRDVFAIPGHPQEPMAALPNHLIQDGAKLILNGLDVIEEYVSVYPELLEYGLQQKRKQLVGRLSDLYTTATPKKKQTVEPGQTQGETTQNKPTLEDYFSRFELQKEEQEILRYLWEQGGEASFDDIADHCGIEIATLSSLLIILQMKKAVMQDAGGIYRFSLS